MVCRINSVLHSLNFSYYWKWVQIVTRQSYMDFPSLFFSRFVLISGSSLQHVPLSSYFPRRSFRDVSENRMHPGSQGTTACMCSKWLVLWGEGGIFFFGCSWPAGSIFWWSWYGLELSCSSVTLRTSEVSVFCCMFCAVPWQKSTALISHGLSVW